MVRHIVLVKFLEDISQAVVQSIWDELLVLQETIPGISQVCAGASESPENMERGYRHGFTIDFESWQALHHYLDHPDHKKLGARLVASAQGGIDGILVVDLECSP